MAIAWACPECHHSVDLTDGNKLAVHTLPGSSVERCSGSGRRIAALKPKEK